MNGYYYRGDKPIYWDDCAAHSNVFYASHVRNGGVELTGPVCDARHHRVKLLAKWVPLDEFEREWKKVTK